MGCGTALPSVALFQWYLNEATSLDSIDLTFADYNPTVLQLVTLPNVLLSWAQHSHNSSWDSEGEFDITPEVTSAFISDLRTKNISLSFLSGTWSPEFVSLFANINSTQDKPLLVLAAETIYSPAATRSFTQTLMEILKQQTTKSSHALVGAKMVYFGVGGSMEDFCAALVLQDGVYKTIREESDGVRRGVLDVKYEQQT